MLFAFKNIVKEGNSGSWGNLGFTVGALHALGRARRRSLPGLVGNSRVADVVCRVLWFGIGNAMFHAYLSRIIIECILCRQGFQEWVWFPEVGLGPRSGTLRFLAF